jgi:hypothetical protein
MLLFALTVRQFSKAFGLPKQSPHWYNSAKRQWFPPRIVRLFQVPGHSRVCGNESADELPSRGTVHLFAGSEPALGVSGQNIRKKIKCSMDNQHMAIWRDLSSTQRQARKLISGPSPTATTTLLSFNRIQSRVVTVLLIGRNTLRRHLYKMRLIDSPLCSRWTAEEETSAHVLCECEPLATLTHIDLGSFFLDPEEVRRLSREAIWNFSKGTGLPWLQQQIMGHKGPVKKASAYWDWKGSNTFIILLYSTFSFLETGYVNWLSRCIFPYYGPFQLIHAAIRRVAYWPF